MSRTRQLGPTGTGTGKRVQGEGGIGKTPGVHRFRTGLLFAAQDESIREQPHAHAEGTQTVGEDGEPVVAFHAKLPESGKDRLGVRGDRCDREQGREAS